MCHPGRLAVALLICATLAQTCCCLFFLLQEATTTSTRAIKLNSSRVRARAGSQRQSVIICPAHLSAGALTVRKCAPDVREYSFGRAEVPLYCNQFNSLFCANEEAVLLHLSKPVSSLQRTFLLLCSYAALGFSFSACKRVQPLQNQTEQNQTSRMNDDRLIQHILPARRQPLCIKSAQISLEPSSASFQAALAAYKTARRAAQQLPEVIHSRISRQAQFLSTISLIDLAELLEE